MGKAKKVGKNRQDKFYKLAKEQGYRARSAFKLIQLNKKFDFLAKARVLIDLCAAPGGWLQVAEKYMPVSSLIIGVDLVPIKPIRHVVTMVNDITSDKCRQDLRKEMKTWKADVVLHDGSPNMGLSWIQDAYTQSDLTLKALKLATEFLVEGGIFVSKVFRSKDYNALLWVFNQLFKTIDVTKPSSSRNESAEIYVICRGFLAPKRIDPKLLDPRTVFMEVETGERVPNIFMSETQKKKERKKPAEGYDTEGNRTLFKTIPASQFIKEETERAVTILATFNQITFQDEDSTNVAAMALTTEEIKECCRDLRVLGRKEFRALLKWKSSVQKILEKDEVKEEEEEEEVKEETEEDKEENLDEELKNMENTLRGLEKKKKKKEREKKGKLREKLRLKMIDPNDRIDIESERELFSLKQVGKSVNEIADMNLSRVDEIMDQAVSQNYEKNHGNFDSKFEHDVSDEEGEEAEAEEDGDEAEGGDEEEGSEEEEAEDPDFDEDEQEKYEEMEAQLDYLYSEYLSRKSGKGVIKNKKRKNKDREEEDPDVGDAEEDAGENPLLMDLEKKPEIPASKKAKLWFDQSIFEGVDEDDDEEIKQMNTKAQQKKKSKSAGNDDDGEEEEEEEGSDWAKSESEPETESDSEPDFDDDLSGDEDDEGRRKSKKDKKMTPEQIALATMMLSKKKKQHAVDDAFNRNAFNDDDLPEWFEDDEKKHRHPNIPVTKMAMQIYREKIKELDSRPIKKVAEARARKKMKTLKRTERLKKQADAIAEAEDITESQKMKQITGLMKAKNKKKKSETKYVVAKGTMKGKGRPSGVKGRYKMVDGRLKKDKKALKRLQKKKK